MALLSAPRAPGKLAKPSISLIAAAVTVALLYFGRDFFITLVISALLAFILDPAVLLAMKLRMPRGTATALVIALAFASIYFVSALVWTQVSKLREDLPTYTSRVNELLDKANTRLEQIEQQTIAAVIPKSLREQEQQIQEKPKEAMVARRRRHGVAAPISEPPAQPVIQEVRIHQDPRPVITTLYGYVSRYFDVLVMASFVPFLVFFMLSSRDRLAEAVLGLFRGDERVAITRSWETIGESTRGFLLGNFILWISLAVFSSAVFFFLGVPYWPLMALLSAAFSLLPYVGLPMSLLPPVLAALAIPNKFKVILLILLFTAALHLLAMNFLYPKIVGRRVRLNPLAVTISLMFWGTLWGGVGLLLAVPIMAAIKAVCDSVPSLDGYGRLLGD